MQRFLLKCAVPAVCAAIAAGCGSQSPEEAAREAEAVKVETLTELLAGYGEAVAKGDAKEAAEKAAAAARTDPTSAEALLARGSAALAAGDSAAALRDFSAVAAEGSLPAGLRSAAMAGKGAAEYLAGNTVGARVTLLRALRLDRRNAAAWYNLGKLYRDALGYGEAATTAFMMAAACPGMPAARAAKVKGETLPELAKSVAKARERAVGAAAKDAADAKARRAKAKKLLAEGEGLEKKKLLKGACGKYAAALEADRTFEDAARKVAKFQVPDDRTDESFDRRMGAYRILIALGPENLQNYREAAELAYGMKRWAHAAQVADRALAHHPGNARMLDVYCAALKKAGRGGKPEFAAWNAYRDEVKKGN